ncbi:MAG: SPOR domain-containing protein [Candidatus Binatia bacterium]
MTWVTMICLAAALAWTAISFAAYSDLDFAFRSSLVAWLMCGALWVVTRLNFSRLVKRVKLFKKRKAPDRHRLAVAGAIVAVLVLIVLTAQWLAKRNTGGDKGFSTALRSEPEPESTKQKSPAQDRSKANRTDTQKAEALWSVQVAAFRSEQDAIRLATVLKERGWEAYVTSADVGAVTLYRIHVGRFRTREAAEKLLIKLRDKEAYTTAFVASM